MSELGFTEEQYDALKEREMLFTDLVDHPGWAALREEVSERLDADRRRILGGSIQDHNEYLRVVWRIQGAEAVLGAPADLSARLNEYRRLLAELQEGQVLNE